MRGHIQRRGDSWRVSALLGWRRIDGEEALRAANCSRDEEPRPVAMARLVTRSQRRPIRISGSSHGRRAGRRARYRWRCAPGMGAVRVSCEESLYVAEPRCIARRWRSRAGRPLAGRSESCATRQTNRITPGAQARSRAPAPPVGLGPRAPSSTGTINAYEIAEYTAKSRQAFLKRPWLPFSTRPRPSTPPARPRSLRPRWQSSPAASTTSLEAQRVRSRSRS